MASTAPPGTRPAPRELARLTSLRAFAAGAVLVFHLLATYRWQPARFLIDGYAGVAFFFILSGFVLTWSVGDAPIALRRFYRARFARIYPAFFVCLAVSWVITDPVSWWVLLSNVTLTHAWLPLSHAAPPSYAFALDQPTWSVSCEVFFYAALPLLVLATRRWSLARCTAAALLWFAACATVTYVVPHACGAAFWGRAVYTNPLVRSGELVLGAVACRLVRSGRLARLSVSAAVVAVLVSAVGTYQWHGRPFPFADVTMTPSLLALIIAAAQADVAGRRGVLTSRALRYAGEVSYSVYVFQFIALLLVLKHVHASAATQSALAVAGTIVGAVVLHHVVERPLRAWITHRPPPAIGAVVPPVTLSP